MRRAVPARLLLALVVVLGFAGGLLILTQADLLSRIINDVFLSKQSLSQVSAILWALLAVVTVRSIVSFLAEGLAGTAAIRIKTGLRLDLTRHLFDLGPASLQSQATGDLVARALQGVENLEGYYSQYLPQLVLAAVIPLTILFFVFPLDLLSAVILLVTAPLIPLFMVLIGKAAENLTRRQFTALSRMSAVFLDTLQGLTTLKALNQSLARAEKIQSAGERYRITTLRVLRVTFLSSLVLELVATLSTAIVAVEIGLRLLYGQLAFQQAFFILVIAPEFYLPLRQLGLRFHAGASGVAAARAIFEILEKIPPVNEGQIRPGEARLASERSDWEVSWRRNLAIDFNEVGFSYPDRPQEALSAVSFSARPGQITALVGASGSGKSTLVQLLLRFVQPQSGEIRISGRPLASIDVHDWRGLVSWVPQHPYLFMGTLAGNIRFARPGATDDEVRQAAVLAELDDFIQSLPQGYATQVGERGVRLSGGQAQRLALARAFLKDAPILLLDEPAAHLDPLLEDQIDAAVRKLCRGRTVLLIAHRPQTIRRADRIVVLADGRVAETGDHAALMALNGLYCRLFARGALE